MMRVLIVFSISHQRQLIENTLKALRGEGLEVDAFDLTSGTSLGQFPKSNCLQMYRWACKLSRLGRVLATPLLLHGMKKILQEYLILDVQGVFAQSTYPIINMAKKMGRAVKVTIWGSELYRSSNSKRRKMTEAFIYADAIQMASAQMKEDFLKVFPSVERKIHLLLYGSAQLGLLREMTEGRHAAVENLISPDTYGKTVLCLGYNAVKAQQHGLMLHAVAQLPEEMKRNLFLLLPLTYGADDKYKQHVIDEARSTGVKYQAFTERLTTEEVLTLRLKTDIAVNIQDSDAFAGSIREHIMAMNLLVVGDWLPYQILDDNGIYVKRTTKVDLRDNILWAIENYVKLQSKLRDNQQKIFDLCSWPSVAKQWVSLYQSMVR